MPLAPEGGSIGMMLPNSNPAVVTLLGIMSAGRVPAMINFSAGLANILSACKTAEVRTLVTSRTFIEKARLAKVIDLLAQAQAQVAGIRLRGDHHFGIGKVLVPEVGPFVLHQSPREVRPLTIGWQAGTPLKP